MSRRGPAPGERLDAVAAVVERIGVLLAAGLDPLSALRALDAPRGPARAAAACAGPHDVAEAVRAEAATGEPEERDAWMLFAARWEVALEAGAPLAESLARTAAGLRAHAEAERQIDLALAGPLATARIVALLPAAGVGLGLLIGADPLGVLFGTVPGAIAGVLGAALLGAGVRWNRRLVARARVHDAAAGVGAELLALALAGGGAPDRALALVAAAAERSGLDASVDEARRVLDFAARAGVPAGVLLRAEAEHAARLAVTGVLRAAAVLGTRLLTPLAVCFLPAFVLLGVVPLVVGMLRDTLAAF